MIPSRSTLLMAAMLLAPATAFAWEPRDESRVFFFGNSLIHHLTDTDETTTPHWIALMAAHSGKTFAGEGTWGFPRDFAKKLPPDANWDIKAMPDAWNHWTQPFLGGRFDTVIFNTENYIQYDPADHRYADSWRETPLDATLVTVDWVMENADAPRFLIYEGWADLHPFAKAVPASDEEMAAYHAHATGDYAAWYDDFVEKLAKERPDVTFDLIPVGRVMSQLLGEAPLSEVPFDALYSDLSPHGTETIYLLAGMIAYAAIFGERPPEGLPLPDSIAPGFADHYEETADAVWQAVTAEASN
ncbi:hypothetical protein [Paracoccus sp. PARArs4]|uniref:hypothetical protein n=1 Tax=Paracoccus sp. PARArs4 TaxID=2853442 RepID=UPI0024A70F25|nr:hypothetical protein [Paracoccus sp. PARArs4]